MEPITTTILNIIVMGGFFISGYLAGNYLVENTSFYDHRNLNVIRPRYNNLHKSKK